MGVASMKLSFSLALSASLLAWTSTVAAQDAGADAKVFGARPAVLDISLSPSGSRIAYLTPADGSHEGLVIVDMKTGASKPLMIMRQDKAELAGCNWATDTQLICTVDYVIANVTDLVGFDRVFAIDAESGKATMMSDRPGFDALDIMQSGGRVVALDPPGHDGKIMMTRQWVPESTTGTRTNSDREGLGVDLVDLASGNRTSVELPDPEAERYVADETGRVRLKVRHLRDQNGNLSGKRVYFYRSADSDRWIELSQTADDGNRSTGFYPVAIDSAANAAIGFMDRGGFDAAYKMTLAAGARPELLVGRDDVDVDSLIRVGRDRRVVGASYATEKRQVVYFDKDFEALAEQLHQALPAKPLISFVDQSADGSKLLLVASSDTDPGMVYLYDKAARKLEEVFPMRNGMSGKAMGAMKPITFAAADGTPIPGYLTLPPGSDGKNLPAIVMPHGGPGARDEWGFDWLVQFFAARGYAVLQPNYRGSTGYGSAWFGRNGFKAWRTAVGDVDDAGRWLVSQGIADPGKLAIVGWSYGGYAALQSQVLDPQLYKAVVAVAPVTDLQMIQTEAQGFTNAALVRRFVGEGPHIVEGSPARNVSSFVAPVLMFHGDLDQNVGITQSRIMAKRLTDAGKSAELVEFPGLEHSLEDSNVRARMLARIDEFLNASLNR